MIWLGLVPFLSPFPEPNLQDPRPSLSPLLSPITTRPKRPLSQWTETLIHPNFLPNRRTLAPLAWQTATHPIAEHLPSTPLSHPPSFPHRTSLNLPKNPFTKNPKKINKTGGFLLGGTGGNLRRPWPLPTDTDKNRPRNNEKDSQKDHKEKQAEKAWTKQKGKPHSGYFGFEDFGLTLRLRSWEERA